MTTIRIDPIEVRNALARHDLFANAKQIIRRYEEGLKISKVNTSREKRPYKIRHKPIHVKGFLSKEDEMKYKKAWNELSAKCSEAWGMTIAQHCYKRFSAHHLCMFVFRIYFKRSVEEISVASGFKCATVYNALNRMEKQSRDICATTVELIEIAREIEGIYQ